MTKPFLSIVIPSYNEQHNLSRGSLNEVLSYLFQQSYEWELILSDDGSIDGTAEKLSEIAASDKRIKLLANPHRGKGPTVTAGMLEATGKWRLFTDFDQSTPLKEVEKLLAWTSSYQVIIGSREVEGALRDKEPFYRHLMGRGFNFLVQILATPGIQDSQCGFKLFSATATDFLFSNLQVYQVNKERLDPFTGAFDVELLFLAQKYNYKIKEAPILWQHHETNRVSPIKDSIRMLADIIKIRIADLMNKYPKSEL